MGNVLAPARDEQIAKFLAELKTLGYIIDSSSLRIENAADHGVPQRRRRMILTATKRGSISHPKIDAERVHVKAAIGRTDFTRR